MIVVDTSALIAVIAREPQGEAAKQMLADEPDVLISAGTMAEALIVSTRRGFSDRIVELVYGFGLHVVPLDASGAREAAAAYEQWGKGVHPARLNLGDCFAYALAKRLACPLLYVGNDFARTDIVSAL